MPWFVFPIVAFLCGSIPFGYLFGKLKGIDIRQHGSGNIGATNVWRVLGKSFGLPCFLLDVLKGFVPVVVVMNLFRFDGMGQGLLFDLPASTVQLQGQHLVQFVHVLCGLCAILGHNYSPWVGFKGGKGIATSAGVLLALFPFFGIALLLLIWLAVFLISRYVSLASIVAAAALPLLTVWGAFHHGKFQHGTWNRSLLAFSVIAGGMAIYKHRSNIERLRQGTENRFKKSA
ncbi:MAG: glycerol-3-phosphate 1-O-acyltransferase [Verrucomicrobia bacterium]|nr:MAG: glycerol-3-phosphate 1-O-acyltransferase [Verrucomicrobiota bacterium]